MLHSILPSLFLYLSLFRHFAGYPSSLALSSLDWFPDFCRLILHTVRTVRIFIGKGLVSRRRWVNRHILRVLLVIVSRMTGVDATALGFDQVSLMAYVRAGHISLFIDITGRLLFV